MFTENEVAALLTNEKIYKPTLKLKAKFIDEAAPFMEISDHDFFSLVLLTPAIIIARANGSISLMEEMALNKKARKYSKGGYFMKSDPVVNAMTILNKHFDDWRDTFLSHLRLLTEATLDKSLLLKSNINADSSDEEFCVEILRSPFMLIRIVSSFFSNAENEDLTAERKVLQVEYDAIIDILSKIDLIDIPLVQKHITKLIIK